MSPNELAFASVTSWQAIYGFPPAGQSQFTKSEFYDIFGGGFEVPCIGSERNPAEHARKKKSLAASFSTKALAAQEHIVQRCWDDFIFKVGPASQRGPQGVNIVSWLEMAAFDILGEMGFGESFECIKNGRIQCLPHSTISLGIRLTPRILQRITISGWISFLTTWRKSPCSITCDDYRYCQFFVVTSWPL